ncbi:MAG TPA: class I SAM-dependent methyltransferase [Acidimicrobiales bacterium]|nr:class I SAM-dependent methyltransferase [Acidimicrobiales bacterium]
MSEQFKQEFWDDRYRSHPHLWSGNPNPHLVTEAEGLAPGKALDAGAGEGADAIWLAKRGWQVTAVDISTVALERAAVNADQAGPDIARRISWNQGDLNNWEPPPRAYDLVSTQYLHVPVDVRIPLVDRLASAVVPGGTLLIVGHHPSDLETTMPRPHEPALFFTGDDIAEQLEPAEWDIVTNAAAGRTTTDPEGRAVTIHDTALCARRHW